MTGPTRAQRVGLFLVLTALVVYAVARVVWAG